MAFNQDTQSAKQSGAKAPRVPPALDPERPAVTQPWKEFISRGWITCLTSEVNPMGYTVSCKVSPVLLKNGETEATLIAPGEVKNRVIEANLWSPKGTGKGKKSGTKSDTDSLLPKKSLVKSDFDAKTSEAFLKRATDVANAIGDTTARGRIGSLKLMIEGVDTFEKWWAVAPASSKARLLMDAKHYKEIDQPKMEALASMLSNCPFRGSVPTPTTEEDDDEEDGEPVAPKTRQDRAADKGKAKA